MLYAYVTMSGFHIVCNATRLRGYLITVPTLKHMTAFHRVKFIEVRAHLISSDICNISYDCKKT